MRSIEAEPNRLYQSLDSEKVSGDRVKRDQINDNSKQFESLEPSRTPLQQPGRAIAIEPRDQEREE